MNLYDLLDEIETLSREQLVQAKNELTADKDIPRKEKGQIMAQIDSRLSSLKKKKEPKELNGLNGGFFYSFVGDGENLSCISRLPVGQFIVRAEPEAMISSFPLTEDEYRAMVEKDWQEFV